MNKQTRNKAYPQKFREQVVKLVQAGGHVVHGFRGLLENLATLTRNTVQVAGEPATFEQFSVPDRAAAQGA